MQPLDQEPLIVGGKLVERNGRVVMIRRYSDQLLVVLLRAHSQKFKTSQPQPPKMPWKMSDEELEAAIEQCQARAEGHGSALDRRHLRLVPKTDT